ncbi:MAG TPA: DUF3160 domain-containing protein [Kofleriaceae bacterium]|nr:DUF3160 domain-containing protein [Kofleriaceae bacterium]
MRRNTILLAVLAACGDARPVPSSTSTAAVTPPELPHHAAPSCPMAPPAPAADDETTRKEGLEGETRKADPTPKGDRCDTADSNLARSEAAILADKPGTAAASRPWDHARVPDRMKLVSRRLALGTAEQKMLADQGFVVPARLTYSNYAQAFHEIYQSELPIYVSVDAILHAIYAGNDSLIADLEDTSLQPELMRVVDALACALPSADYPAAARRDLDLYISVARALIRGAAPESMFGDPAVEAEAGKLVDAAVAAQEMSRVSMFGRERMIDFTAYTPRSHYAANETRQRYFRAGMWLSRLEFNLVSRSSRSSQPGDTPDPSETPREAVDAIALADLVTRANVAGDVARLDTAWALLAGRREDVSVAQLAKLSIAPGDPAAAAKLAHEIGNNFQRTARLHYMPQGSKILPAITTLLGPRVVPDAAATRPLVNGEVPDRMNLTAADMAYVLGHDRALAFLADDRAKFPTLDNQLAVARNIVRTTPRGRDDLYSAWLDAVVGLAEAPAGRPSFMTTPAYADLRIDSALAAFGHIKHNFVLIAGESYFEGGCEIPDGYVEPAPATYAALLDYAARGDKAMRVLDADGKLGGSAYFQRLAGILRVLQMIQRDELADRKLTDDERAFLSMVAEMEPGSTGGPPSYTGWWFDLFRQRELDGLAPAGYIASYFTGDKIAYVGATSPRLGVFVVDTGGPPRVVVGPVARAYEYHGEVAHRLDDAAALKLAESDREAPWAASYTVAAPPAPRMSVTWGVDDKVHGVVVKTDAVLGPVTLEFYDHHRLPLTKMTKDVKPGVTMFPLRAPKDLDGLHVQVGAFHGWMDFAEVGGGIWGQFGGWSYEDDQKIDGKD